MVWVDSQREARRQRKAARASGQRQAAIGAPGMNVTRYAYAPRAECQDCDFTLRSRNGAVNKRSDKVRTAAQQHVTEMGHEVHVIIQDVTHYVPAR